MKIPDGGRPAPQFLAGRAGACLISTSLPVIALTWAWKNFPSRCRIDDEFVYEIALLHQDGKYFHAHVNARDRQARRIQARAGARRPRPERRASRDFMRLLVVEDDRDLNRQVATALEARGLRRRPRL